MIKYIFVNSITAIRGLCSIAFLFFPAFSIPFYIFYSICGISDALDGFLARKLNATSNFGKNFDTICDVIFLISTSIIVFSNIKLFLYIYIWIAIIAIIKIFNIFYSLTKNKANILPHTTLNKITGFVFFISIYFITIINANIVLSVVCLFATISALNECFLINAKK